MLHQTVLLFMPNNLAISVCFTFTSRNLMINFFRSDHYAEHMLPFPKLFRISSTQKRLP